MKSKVDAKKVVSSDSSSSSDSSDDEPTVKAPSKATAAAAKTTTPKSSQEKATPAKVEKAPKAAAKTKESSIPKSVPVSKFPKRNTTSSSDSSSSSDEEPIAKKAKHQPVNNKLAANNHPVVASPEHQPVASAIQQSPKRDPPAPLTHTATPVKRALGSQAPVLTSVPASKSAPVTAAGDEQYKRTDTKKVVTNLFNSNCPHCGHDIEVRLKLS